MSYSMRCIFFTEKGKILDQAWNDSLKALSNLGSDLDIEYSMENNVKLEGGSFKNKHISYFTKQAFEIKRDKLYKQLDFIQKDLCKIDNNKYTPDYFQLTDDQKESIMEEMNNLRDEKEELQYAANACSFMIGMFDWLSERAYEEDTSFNEIIYVGIYAE